MKKEKAITLLESLISDLKKPHFHHTVWVERTTTIVKKVFPKTGAEKAECIEDIEFVILAPMVSDNQARAKKREGISKAENFLQSFITEINQLGTESFSFKISKNTSELGRLINNKFFYVFIGFVITVILPFTFYIGKKWQEVKIDKNTLTLEKKITNLNTHITAQSDSILNLKNSQNQLLDSIVELTRGNIEPSDSIKNKKTKKQ